MHELVLIGRESELMDVIPGSVGKFRMLSEPIEFSLPNLVHSLVVLVLWPKEMHRGWDKGVLGERPTIGFKQF